MATTNDEVFVLIDETGGEYEFVGVFSSRERALEWLQRTEFTSYSIQQVRIDKIPSEQAPCEERTR